MVGLKCFGDDPAFFDFLANPTSYLIQRGVQRIVYLHGAGGEEPEQDLGADALDEPPSDNALEEGIGSSGFLIMQKDYYGTTMPAWKKLQVA
jgi:hypothetical protein